MKVNRSLNLPQLHTVMADFTHESQRLGLLVRRANACPPVHVGTYVCMNVWMHVCTYVCMNAYMYFSVCKNVCMNV